MVVSRCKAGIKTTTTKCNQEKGTRDLTRLPTTGGRSSSFQSLKQEALPDTGQIAFYNKVQRIKAILTLLLKRNRMPGRAFRYYRQTLTGNWRRSVVISKKTSKTWRLSWKTRRSYSSWTCTKDTVNRKWKIHLEARVLKLEYYNDFFLINTTLSL